MKAFPSLHRVRSLIQYDPLSGVFRWLVSRRGYRGIKAGQEAGSIGRQGYRSIRIDGRYCRASNVAWLLMTGEWPGSGMKVDHRKAAAAVRQAAAQKEYGEFHP